MELNDKVAVITGAGQGIGRGIALRLATHGADIVIPDINLDAAKSVAAEVEALGRRALPVLANCTKSNDIERLFDTVQQEFHHLDILVNNNPPGGARKLAVDYTEDEWEVSIRGGLTGYFLCAQRAAKDMIKQGTGGKIISISSVAAHATLGFKNSGYATAKAAILGMTRSLALELAAYKINVNAIAPGFIDTPMARRVLSQYEIQARLNAIPMGRYGLPEDIGKVAVFLASDDSDYIHGQTLFVDGGMTLYPEFARGG